MIVCVSQKSNQIFAPQDGNVALNASCAWIQLFTTHKGFQTDVETCRGELRNLTSLMKLAKEPLYLKKPNKPKKRRCWFIFYFSTDYKFTVCIEWFPVGDDMVYRNYPALEHSAKWENAGLLYLFFFPMLDVGNVTCFLTTIEPADGAQG